MGSTFEKPIITTCGSGVTAAILALAVEEAGGKVAGLYDGSWAEWGSRADCPVATGRVGRSGVRTARSPRRPLFPAAGQYEIIVQRAERPIHPLPVRR